MEISSNPTTSYFSSPFASLSGRIESANMRPTQTAEVGQVSRSEPSEGDSASTASAQDAKQEGHASAKSHRAGQQLSEAEQLEIKQLAARDREVRAHEQAHMAVGGQYAGAASYEYQRGPDGVNYAIGGEVPISTGAEPTPEATLRKAQIVRRAALAPAEPSAQDRRVAAAAAQMENQARLELSRAHSEQAQDSAQTDEQGESTGPDTDAAEPERATQDGEAQARQAQTGSAIVNYAQIGSLRGAAEPERLHISA